jgi:type 2A phosphatase activator TIP41
MAASSKKTDDRTFEAGPWRISLRKSHILKSSCERGSKDGCSAEEEACFVCKFHRELRALPALPEMVFPDSWLRLDHETGCGLGFYALDALRRVDATRDPLKVAAAEEWGKTREDSMEKVKDIVQPFDWTFTTDYTGTLLTQQGAHIQVNTLTCSECV